MPAEEPSRLFCCVDYPCRLKSLDGLKYRLLVRDVQRRSIHWKEIDGLRHEGLKSTSQLAVGSRKENVSWLGHDLLLMIQ